MRKIVLLCAQGMSSGMLMKRIREAAMEQSYECEIKAFSVSQAAKSCADADCILIGPQVRYELETVSNLFPDKPVFVVDLKDYGRLNGKNVLNAIKEKLND